MRKEDAKVAYKLSFLDELNKFNKYDQSAATNIKRRKENTHPNLRKLSENGGNEAQNHPWSLIGDFQNWLHCHLGEPSETCRMYVAFSRPLNFTTGARASEDGPSTALAI